MAGTHAAAAARSAVTGGTWGTAEEVPGTAALNTGGYADITSVSCAAAGNCSAGGFYNSSSSGQQAFVVDETNGSWGTAETVAAARNTGGDARILSVSCTSAGNCTAGGYYSTVSYGHGQAFVVNETNGTWGTAEPVAAGLNHGTAWILSVSCASAGNCSAGGYYASPIYHYQAFVVGEINGTWGTAKTVAAALNTGKDAEIRSVSCATAGNCSAGGDYANSSGTAQSFVVSQANGTWGTAKPVATALNKGYGLINSVSCGAAGNCSATGYYTPSSGFAQFFVVSQANGTWGTVKTVEKVGTQDLLSVISCATAGNCTAGGGYTRADGYQQAFVVSETNGTWGTAEPVPGTRSTSKAGQAEIWSLSCAAAGNCSAGGQTGARYYQHAFVDSAANGTWGTAEQVPGLTALNQGKSAAITSVSCASAGNCGAGGAYEDSSDGRQAFVVSKTNTVAGLHHR